MRFLRNSACGLLLCGGLVMAGGCESTDDNGMTTQPSTQASMGMINDTCPMSGHAVDGKTMVEYRGHTVGMCCAGCKDAWQAMSRKKKASSVRKTMHKQ